MPRPSGQHALDAMSLVLDALDRVLAEPQTAQRWHRLMAFREASSDVGARQAALDRLKTAEFADPRTEILRLTFLARATGDDEFEVRAAQRTLEILPADPDRLAASLAFRWLSALQDLDGREAFVAALVSGMAPELAARLARLATDLPPVLLPRAARDVQRVAVVTPYIGHRFHTPSAMAVEQCRVLARSGLQVRVFSAQELVPPDAGLFRGDGRDLKLPPLDARSWSGLLPAGVNMTIADVRYGLAGRWKNLLATIAEFDPDAVLLVGLYSPFAAALHAVRPAVGISVNSVPPLAPLDVWLAAPNETAEQDPWRGRFAATRCIEHPYRIRRRQDIEPLSRAQLDIADDAVVWVTAGFRLEHEIRGEWARRVADLVARRPEVVWLIVGGEGTMPAALAASPGGRIRALPTRDDLPAVLRCSDIYVNPPRMGGGFSVAEAMGEGLAVATLGGSDGGDKVGALAFPDLDGYLRGLEALTESAEARRSMGTSLQQRFAERFDLDSSGPALLAAFREAAQLAQERFNRPS